MRISDWSSDVCSSDLESGRLRHRRQRQPDPALADRRQDVALLRVGTTMSGQTDCRQRPRRQRQDRQAARRGQPPASPAPDGGKAMKASTKFGALMSTGAALCLAAGTAMMVAGRSEAHTSELPSLMRISYAVFCLKKK